MDGDKKINFKTFAVFDLETTGFPDRNFNKANIIEFCVSAISKNDLENTKKNDLPRIIKKLSLSFNPGMRISYEVTKITGLDNFMLEHHNRFDENAANSIISFFKHLNGPVCLIAHNGNKFDFPILKKSFEKLNLSLPENVYCVDTYVAIPYIDALKKQEKEEEEKIKNEDETLLNLDEEFIKDIPTCVLEECYEIDKDEIKNKELKINVQQINETTPKRNTKKRNQNFSYLIQELRQNSAKLSNFNDTPPSTPPDLSDRENCNKKEIKARKKLFESSPSSNLKNSIKVPRSPKGYYTLGGMFKRIFYEPKNTHRADADVEMLLKLVIFYGNDFIQYSEVNSSSFSDIKCGNN